VFGHLLSTSQLIALVAIVTAAGITLWRQRRLPKAG
jgi:hypothetical protein